MVNISIDNTWACDRGLNFFGDTSDVTQYSVISIADTP